MKQAVRLLRLYSIVKAGILTCLLIICLTTAKAQTVKKVANQYQVGYQYILRGSQRTPMRYTRSYSGGNGVFVTIYKLYHPIRGTHALTITATHYKDDQKVVVKVSDTSGSIFSEINTEQTTYEGVPLAAFGFRGAVGGLGGPSVPNQLGIQFASGTAENVKVLSVAGSHENGDFEFFVLDKEALLKPVAGSRASKPRGTVAFSSSLGERKGSLGEGKALYGPSNGPSTDSTAYGSSLEMAGWQFVTEPQVEVVDSVSGIVRFKIKLSYEGEVESVTKVSGNVSVAQEKLCRDKLLESSFMKTNNASGGATGFYNFRIQGLGK